MTGCRLGVNIDHIATLRQARRESFPNPLSAVPLIEQAGAHSITVHVREDRRHIQVDDVADLVHQTRLPLNLELAAEPTLVETAIRHKVTSCCFVPEKREELTTEGGLDVCRHSDTLRPFVRRLQDAGIEVSLFIDSDEAQIDAAAALGVDSVELHTGEFAVCLRAGKSAETLLHKLEQAARRAEQKGLLCHAGHGLDYDSAAAVAAIAQIHTLNIGHFLISESIFVGLEVAVKKMLHVLSQARAT